MSAGTGQPKQPPSLWGEVAAKNARSAYEEAHGAHRNTRRILQIMKGGGEEAAEDPVSQILEAQDMMMDLLSQMREEIGQLRAQIQTVQVRLGIG